MDSSSIRGLRKSLESWLLVFAMMTTESGEDGTDGVCGTSVACVRTRTRVCCSSSETNGSPMMLWASKPSDGGSRNADVGMDTTRGVFFSRTVFMWNLGAASGRETVRNDSCLLRRVWGLLGGIGSIFNARVVVVMDRSAVEPVESKEMSV